MKTRSIFLTILLFCGGSIFAQSQADSLGIREASLNYIEGFYSNDFERVEKALHPELAKRIIVKDANGNQMLRNMGASELIFNAKNFKRPEDTSGEVLQVNVIILDISTEIATAKVTQNKMNFFDYIHLGKFNGKWQIINVLWARTNP